MLNSRFVTSTIIFALTNLAVRSRLLHCSTVSASKLSMETTQYSVSYVTIDDKQKADKLAESIVENGLAACVNIVPQITSVYKWEGKIHKDNELLMIIKTRTSRLQELTEFVQKNHGYDVPEVISLPITQGNQAYLDWIAANVPEKKDKTDL